jgi:SGNH hydrolase-like domain, acetyltransferase AlgX
MSTVSNYRRSRASLVQIRRRPDKTMAPMPREDLSKGIIQTEVSPALAKVMTAVFLAVIVVLPVIQAGIERGLKRHVQALDVFKRVPTRENLSSFEKELSRHSAVRRAIQPRLQLALSRFLGFGNTNVIIGQDGWLFYRPGVEYLTGPGLLDEDRLRLRERELFEAGEKRACPDPRPAIRDFNELCRKAGSHLVIVPIPDKSMHQPAELTSRLAFQGVLAAPNNPDCERFLDGLRAEGVDVFEPTPEYLVAGEPPRFLRQDTHWTPLWMEMVAHGLAEYVKRNVPLDRGSSRSFYVHQKQVSRVGDIVDMLQLPADQRLFPPQSITIQRVMDSRTGAAWQPKDGADVLLLGDSFSNIYCAADMGWGDAAGFPAQLARFLERDVDVIARNGSGATSTRRELARRPTRLGGKRLVVWEFAMRDLVGANWELVPIPATTASDGVRPDVERNSPLIIEATVVATSHVPRPFLVPYKDCLTYIKLHVDRVVEGALRDDQLIAIFWGMRDNVLLPAANYRAGQRLRLEAVSIKKAPLNLQSVRRVDDLDDFDHSPYFIVKEEPL